MDALQAIVTSIGVIGLILLMVLLVLHFFGPKTGSWIHSSREEKIGFSKNKIFHANGYLIQSSSEFLLNSTGSFKRFDSIDRDYKPIDETSSQSLSWAINVPPQPLRPAPSPSPSSEFELLQEHLLQQNQEQTRSQSEMNTVIPRPQAKRQHSSPANFGISHINLSDVVAKIANGPKSCTNPFLNGSLSISEDSNSNEMTVQMNENQINVNQNTHVNHKNPFSRQHDGLSIFSFPTNGNIDENSETNFSITDSYDAQIDAIDTLIQLNDQCANNSSNFEINSMHGIDDKTTTPTSNPFTTGNLHKTVSETYLEQYSMQKIRINANKQQNSAFSRTLSRQSIPNVLSTQNSINLNDTELKRAMSCDSVNSESSVLLSDLVQQNFPEVTGQICVGLQYDKNTLTDEGIELVLTVMEAKDLIGTSNVEQFDTFVRVFMIPEESPPLQTKLFRNSRCPSYNETFSFWLNNKTRAKRTLFFHLFHSGSVHTLIGETEYQIGDVRRPITIWLTLSDTKHNNSPYGELMFSLSYLPTAERLTVVVVKARNLKADEQNTNYLPQNIFVKVYLLKDDKKVSKKKTSLKRSDSSPIYNESMIFSVPPYMLNSIQIRLTVVSVPESTENAKPIGHVIVGCSAAEKGIRHWHQMLASIRKPVAMWHAVRQTTHSMVQTGNS